MHFAQWSLNTLAAFWTLLVPKADATAPVVEASVNVRGHNVQLDPRSPGAAETAPMCNVPEMNGAIFTEKLKDIDDWMLGIMQRFRDNPGTHKTFFSFVLQTNFPTLLPSHTSCNFVNDCDPVSCALFRDILEGESQEKYEHERAMAVYAATAITNFHNFYRSVGEAFESASNHIKGLLDGVWHTFSWDDNYYLKDKKAREKKARITKIAIAVGLLVILLVTAGVGAYAETIVAGAVGTAVNEAQKGMKHAVDAVNAANSAASGAYSGTTAIFSAVVKGGEGRSWLDHKEIEFKHVWELAAAQAKETLNNATLALMEGKQDDSSGANIITILRNQWFYLPLDAQLKPRLQRLMNKEMLASTINLLWSSGTTNAWIVRSKAVPNCKEDARIRPEARVCLDNETDWTYFVAGTDNFKDKKVSLLHLLPGWQSMREKPGEYENITVEEVVASSLKWWRLVGNHGFDAGAQPAGFNASQVLGQLNDVATSAIHLPVCNNPGGEALSSLNEEEQLSFPCVCAKQDGSPDDFSPQSETLGVLKTSGLITRPKVYDHCKKAMDCTGKKGNPYRLDCGEQGSLRGKKVASGWCEKETFTAWGSPPKHDEPGRIDDWLDNDWE